ncbi:nucleic-acid-binding protein from transposon X-element [Nephila pilipes]|uniref:Nucleic-acid-binding protein from transposon X-element n=1 Tax=Nephila pilipes TaxID=299642 RepID=A0A8X6NIA9_NEPPI|nr:nucleic-acid-binding protein from transposon X-element [Nephila pilipes]
MESQINHELTSERSNYENFHNQFDVNSLVQMLEHACTAEALTRVVNVVEATLSALQQYPFDEDEQQRLNVLELEEISDEAKNRYITARRSELRAAAAALDDTAQAWGKKFFDDDFTVVKTKKKSKNTISDNLAKKQKIEDITPYHNKFGHLTIEDAPSTSANDMDTSPPSPTRTAQRTSTPPQSPRRRTQPQQSPRPSTSNQTPGIKKPPVPPITIDKITNPATLLKKLQDFTKIKLIAKLTGTSLKVFPPTAHAYHKLRRYVEDNKLQGHTYMLPEERKLRVVIRGMPVDMPTDDIAEELREKGFTIHQIYIMTNKSTGAPMPLFLTILDKNEHNQKIFNLKELACMQVTVEALRKKYGPPQCFRCQGFFHSSNYCTRAPKCVKCAGEHLTRECIQDPKTPPTCCLCGGPHPANYLQCPRNPASHPLKPKQVPPRQENSWRKRLQMTSAPPQPAPRQTLQLTEEEFPQLPSPPQKTRQTPPTNYQAIQNPLEMLKDPDVQDLYNTLEKFVNIAKNVKSPAERLQALFKLLN